MDIKVEHLPNDQAGVDGSEMCEYLEISPDVLDFPIDLSCLDEIPSPSFLKIDTSEKSIEPIPEIKEPRAFVSASKRYDVMNRDDFKCVLCGKTGQDTKLEVDHIIPVADGGTTGFNNLQTLCFVCNRGKGQGEQP